MTKKFLTLFGFGLAMVLPSAFANVIGPGSGEVSPDTLTVGAGATLVATTTGPILFSAPPPPTFTATYTAWVYKDPTNTFCAGCLDFVYQVSDTTPKPLPPDQGIIERVTAAAFSGFSTDVGYTPATGTVAPGLVDRSVGAGDVIGWSFASPDIMPGQNTDLLVIETNARSYTMGTISAQDGTAGNALAYAPSSVPEPFTMGLVGGGLALLGITRWRKSSKKD